MIQTALTRLLAMLACIVVSIPALAGDIRVENAWALPLPPVSVNGAAYLAVENSGSSTDRLVGAESSISERVELHKHVNKDGQMSMQKVDFVEIPMHGSAVFSPGNMHVMLIGLTEPLVEGNHFQLRLNFEKAGEVAVMVMINAEGALSMQNAGHGNHTLNTE